MKKLLLILFLTMIPLSTTLNSNSNLDIFKVWDILYYEYVEKWKIIEFIELKLQVNYVLKDVSSFFNINEVDKNHLLYMEEMRVKYEIPFNLYYRLILRESWFNENVTSRVGAKGYLQIMPSTFIYIKTDLELDVKNINDPYDNIKAGAYYLKYLKNKVDENYNNLEEDVKWILVLASYNGGYSRKHLARRSFNETQEYIKFITFKL